MSGIEFDDIKPSPLIGFFGAIFLTMIGVMVHAANLDKEPAMRSYTLAFAGANMGFGWLLFGVDPGLQLDYCPLALVPVFAGLVIGVLFYDGDLRREQKKWVEDQEAERVMRIEKHAEERLKKDEWEWIRWL